MRPEPYPLSERGGAPIAIPVGDGQVHFKVEVRGYTFRFFFSLDEKVWSPLGEEIESLKLSDDYVNADQEGFFTGAFVGMCANDLSGARLHADFAYFSYNEHSRAFK